MKNVNLKIDRAAREEEAELEDPCFDMERLRRGVAGVNPHHLCRHLESPAAAAHFLLFLSADQLT